MAATNFKPFEAGNIEENKLQVLRDIAQSISGIKNSITSINVTLERLERKVR